MWYLMKDVVLMKDNLTRRNWFEVKHVFFSHEKTPNTFLISFYLACRFLTTIFSMSFVHF
jgi:hypothetical protein